MFLLIANFSVVGLGVSWDEVHHGNTARADSVLQQLLGNRLLTKNTMVSKAVAAEVMLVARRVRAGPGSSVEATAQLQLITQAYKEARTGGDWCQADLRQADRQDLQLLWLAPQLLHLQLTSLQRVTDFYSQISSPREWKCYAKAGLRLAQTNCLSLRTAACLISLAQSNLTCDDAVAAAVQLAGTRFILQQESDLKAVNTTKVLVLSNIRPFRSFLSGMF